MGASLKKKLWIYLIVMSIFSSGTLMSPKAHSVAGVTAFFNPIVGYGILQLALSIGVTSGGVLLFARDPLFLNHFGEKALFVPLFGAMASMALILNEEKGRAEFSEIDFNKIKLNPQLDAAKIESAKEHIQVYNGQLVELNQLMDDLESQASEFKKLNNKEMPVEQMTELARQIAAELKVSASTLGIAAEMIRSKQNIAK